MMLHHLMTRKYVTPSRVATEFHGTTFSVCRSAVWEDVFLRSKCGVLRGYYRGHSKIPRKRDI